VKESRKIKTKKTQRRGGKPWENGPEVEDQGGRGGGGSARIGTGKVGRKKTGAPRTSRRGKLQSEKGGGTHVIKGGTGKKKAKSLQGRRRM